MTKDIINDEKITDLLVNHSAKPSMNVDEKGNLLSDGWKVSPFFYFTAFIRWDIFLTLHYKGSNDDPDYKGRVYNRDTTLAEKNRKIFIAALLRRVKEDLGLKSRDLQYFGVTEMQNGRCHTHTLIHIKDNVISAPLLKRKILKLINWEVVTIPENKLDQAVIIPDDSKKVAAYISKLNKNDMEIQPIHFSREFIRFVKRQEMPTLVRNYPINAPDPFEASSLPF